MFSWIAAFVATVAAAYYRRRYKAYKDLLEGATAEFSTLLGQVNALHGIVDEQTAIISQIQERSVSDATAAELADLIARGMRKSPNN